MGGGIASLRPVRPSVRLSVPCRNAQTVHFMGMVIVEQKWEISYWKSNPLIRVAARLPEVAETGGTYRLAAIETMPCWHVAELLQ